MKVASSRIFKMNIIFIVVLLTISCDKESDLLVDYVHSDNLHKEQLDEFAVEDFSRLNTDQSVVVDALANEIYID
jgi:hypothetical protein